MNYRIVLVVLGLAIGVTVSAQALDAGSLQLHTLLKDNATADKNVVYNHYLRSLDDMPSLLRVAIYGLGMLSLCEDSPQLTESERLDWLSVARNAILQRLEEYLAPGGHPDLTPGGPAEKLSRQMAAILVQVPLTVTPLVADEIKTYINAVVFTALRDGMCFLPQWQREPRVGVAAHAVMLDWRAAKERFWSLATRWCQNVCVIGVVMAILGYLLHNTERGKRWLGREDRAGS